MDGNQWVGAMRPRIAASLVLIIVCAAAFVAAQRPTAPPTTFRGGVDIVQLDVSVLDRDRRPVRGLTVKDFTVTVDGRQQPIVAFKAVDLPPPPVPSVGWTSEVAPDVATNARPSGRVIAILIDDYSFSEAAIELAGVRKARQTALAVVDELGPDDRAAVVFTGYGRTAQTFTSDRALLRTAIEKAPLFGSDLTPDDSTGRGFCYCGVCSIDALGRVAASLRSLPEQRKILFYISAGAIIEIPRWMTLDECIQRKRDAMHDAIRQAHLANVTIEAFDPKGLIPMRGRSAARGGNPNIPNWSDPLEEAATRRIEFLRTMAETTGGRALVNDNDVERHVPAVLAESSSYYLLGVERPASREEGQLHGVEVRVNRRGVNVRTRRGYYDPTRREVETTAAMAASGDPTQAILGAIPKSTIPLDLAVAPIATSGRQSGLAIALGVTASVSAEVGSAAPAVEVLAQLFRPETGQSAGSRRSQVSATWRRPDASSGYYEVLSQIMAPPGRYELRVGLRAEDGRTSSVYTSVEIPNFDEDLSVSGLVLSADPAAESGPPDAFAGLLPVTPTARRLFRRTDRVSAFLRVYQNTESFARTTLKTRLIDTHNRTVVDQVKDLDGTPSSTGSIASHLAELPISSLAAGEYLLTIDTEARGKTVRRTARLRIE